MEECLVLVVVLCENSLVYHATDSGSARFKADLTARTVQARVAAGSTSQSVLGLGGPYIYNEPNKKSSVFIGNLTWVCTVYVQVSNDIKNFTNFVEENITIN